jgi:holo-[acyl-carrier protein] synthase
MIVGLGVDILEIDRMTAMLSNHPVEFCRKILSEAECTYYKNYNPSLIATLFTVKEAFVKALGIGFREGISLQSISVIDDKIFYPKQAEAFLLKKNAKHLSFSHMTTSIYAISMVILET